MDSAKKDILGMLDTREYFLTHPDNLRANSRYLITDILRDHDHLRAKLPPQKPLPPLPVVAGKKHSRRHKKKRGKKTRNNRN